MTILVTGSRTWSNVQRIAEAFVDLHHETPNEPVTLIHGDAMGVDTLAAAAARELGWSTVAVPVTRDDWRQYGKRAGILRNIRMLDMKPDRVYAFWDGTSRGTKHCVDEARRRGFDTRVFLNT